MLRIPASAPGSAARLRTAARRTPPAHQYSTPFHMYFSIMWGFSFCVALFAVPTSLPVSRCPAALSAPVGAPVTCRSICFRRGPSSARGSRLCPPSPDPPLPPAVSLPFPAHLRPSAPFLLSLCPAHPPFTIPYLRRLPDSSSPAALLASRPPVHPAPPWPLAPCARRSGPCHVLRLAPVQPLCCNSSGSIRTLGFFPFSWGQSRLTLWSASASILLHRPSSISGPRSPELPALPTRSLKGWVPRLSRLPLVR